MAEKIELTRDTQKIFALIWKTYEARREYGVPKNQAIEFTESIFQSDLKLCEWDNLDINEALLELKSAGLISRNVLGDFKLLNDGIIKMEKNAVEVAKDLLNIAAKAVPLIAMVM